MACIGHSSSESQWTCDCDGYHQYPSDIVRPGMLYGKVLRPRSYGATLQTIQWDAAESIPNVKVVRDEGFVGCVAPNSWTATQAIGALAATAKWDSPAHPDSDELYEHLRRTAQPRGGERRGRDADTWGDHAAGMAAARDRLNTSYTIAYIQHAPMEPRAAVAEWSEGKLTVWTGSQQPLRVRGDLANAFHLPQENVRVIVPDTGGGFGGKHSGEVAVEAARLAQAAGKPVSLRWRREEEFVWAYCRPAGLIEVEAGVNAAGKLTAWSFTNYNSGGSAIETPYAVPHGKTQYVATDSPLRQGSYRALASTANTFARESAMDELAAQANIDPLEFRLAHLPQGRLRDVLQAAAQRFDWSARRTKPAECRGVGLACGTEKGSYVAACAEVALKATRSEYFPSAKPSNAAKSRILPTWNPKSRGASSWDLAGRCENVWNSATVKLRMPAFRNTWYHAWTTSRRLISCWSIVLTWCRWERVKRR